VPKVTPELSFYAEIVRVLEEVKAPYMIIGAFAAAAYGSTRVTHDIDIVVNLAEKHIQALARRYPPPRYYADPQQIRDSIRLGILFNLIDTDRGEKVDLIPVTMDPHYRQALKRRVRLGFEDLSGEYVKAWYARPDDVIVGKLKAWTAAEGRRHEQDISAMLVFLFSGADPTLDKWFDEAYVDRRAASLGARTSKFWADLKKAARAQATR